MKLKLFVILIFFYLYVLSSHAQRAGRYKHNEVGYEYDTDDVIIPIMLVDSFEFDYSNCFEITDSYLNWLKQKQIKNIMIYDRIHREKTFTSFLAIFWIEPKSNQCCVKIFSGECENMQPYPLAPCIDVFSIYHSIDKKLQKGAKGVGPVGSSTLSEHIILYQNLVEVYKYRSSYTYYNLDKQTILETFKEKLFLIAISAMMNSEILRKK